MQQFQIKQKMWSLGGQFTVSDEFGQPAYHVEGSFFQIPKTFTITDLQGNLVSQIEKELLSFLPRFTVRLQDGSSFVLRKELTFFRPRYHIEDLGLTIQGDFWDMEFDLYQDGRLIARISQEWLRMTSTYQIRVLEEKWTDLIVSLVVAIDYVKEMESSAS